MKISKQQLQQIIKEELDNMDPAVKENPKHYIISVLKECSFLLKNSVLAFEKSGKEDLARRATAAAIHAMEAYFKLEELR